MTFEDVLECRRFQFLHDFHEEYATEAFKVRFYFNLFLNFVSFFFTLKGRSLKVSFYLLKVSIFNMDRSNNLSYAT